MSTLKVDTISPKTSWTTDEIAGNTVSPTGSVLQVVVAGDATGTTTTSTSHGDTSCTLTITPTSASSNLLILVTGELYGTGGNESNWFALGVKEASTQLTSSNCTGCDGDGDISEGASHSYSPHGANGYGRHTLHGQALRAASSTDSRTYTVTFREVYSNGTTGYARGTITVMEIAG